MDWIAVGAIAEILGALALVLTLAYLAIQVTHSTQSARRAAVERAVDSVREWNRILIDNPDVADVYWKGTEGIENLSNQRERSQFGVMSYNLFKTCEQLHYQHMVGSMESSMWTGIEWQMRGNLLYPGHMQWWQERRHAFGQEFQDFISHLTPDTERVFNPPASVGTGDDS